MATCAAACAAELRCGYFFARPSDGRCCLKAAYDSGARTRPAPGGAFYALTARGPPPPPPPPPPPGSETRALILVVGHLRHYEQELADHFRLVAAVGAALGVAPAVCIATYPKRDHHDKTWWHGGTTTADTAKAVDPAAVAANYKVEREAVHMLAPSSVREPAKYTAFIQQQAKISFNVHVGTFTSIAEAYTLCTGALAPARFELVIRTRPDAAFVLG